MRTWRPGEVEEGPPNPEPKPVPARHPGDIDEGPPPTYPKEPTRS